MKIPQKGVHVGRTPHMHTFLRNLSPRLSSYLKSKKAAPDGDPGSFSPRQRNSGLSAHGQKARALFHYMANPRKITGAFRASLRREFSLDVSCLFLF
jgi:hypothetical protein